MTLTGMKDDPDYIETTGPTRLIAIMRAIVINRLGEEIKIPEELLGEIK
jgi:hypothetical protein